MLPYHLGALASLEYNGMLHPQNTPIAGSSAGSIAAVSYGCGIHPERVLEATIQVSDGCAALGGARGRLLPLLEQQLQGLVKENEFDAIQNRPGIIGLGYKEIFPTRRDYLQTTFESREDLFRATQFSCMFPFFSTNFPCILDWSNSYPRLMVDGYFSVPRDRFGCPDFDMVNPTSANDGGADGDAWNRSDIQSGDTSTRQPIVDRTVGIAAFPKNVFKIDAFDDEDCISPRVENEEDVKRLIRIATQASSREELTGVYEEGWKDAEVWCRQEQHRSSADRATGASASSHEAVHEVSNELLL